ncbi:CBS domain containing membrane protein [Methanohalobium evestigatum Z-7303]|uniref:CBS domain containing membrane protein n=1 Tax=Methanohalobium evestigatum (strain ATCC BAA-1072 / DSM 3721 / NBRC 107634 / OCM 161 / Z-7303) TaxID=644295 RepID=D7E5T0_METEZ|nr:CBS domain-containing protein [Methanohalobium evestigatum]ADI72952.1 CBS domain containing membrane protein [Methanohalobium evestigatum Z-7303]
MQVKEIMVEPPTIDKSDTTSHALDVMEKKNTRRLLVTHDDKIMGVLTMRSLNEELGTRKKGNKPASSLHVATAVSDDYSKVLPDTDIKDAITLMKNKGKVIVVTDNDDIYGWVTPEELLKNNHFDGYAGEIMQKDPLKANPSDRVIHIRHQMLENNIGRVPVVEDEKIVGIVTEKDIAKSMRAFRDLVAGNKQDTRIRNLIIEDIMTRGAKTVYTNTPTSDVVNMMIEDNIGGVPVLNLEDELVGIITRRNIIESMAD